MGNFDVQRSSRVSPVRAGVGLLQSDRVLSAEPPGPQPLRAVTVRISSLNRLPAIGSGSGSGSFAPVPLGGGWYLARIMGRRDAPIDVTRDLSAATVGNTSSGQLVYCQYLPERGTSAHSLKVGDFHIAVPADNLPDGTLVYNIGAAGIPAPTAPNQLYTPPDWTLIPRWTSGRFIDEVNDGSNGGYDYSYTAGSNGSAGSTS